MFRPRLRLRTLMIMIAVFALVFLFWRAWRDLNRAMFAFYGPDGVLARQIKQSRSFAESVGDGLLRGGRFADAEAQYRRALAAGEALSVNHGDNWQLRLTYKLADALAAQRRDEEAEDLYEYAITILGGDLSLGDRALLSALDNYPRFLEKTGHTTRAQEIRVRVRKIRADRSVN
jgi:tetratricopeptide (TPR) repeat protein